MKILVTITILALVACSHSVQNKNHVSNTSDTVDSDMDIRSSEQSDFSKFLYRFNHDTAFQFAHVEFPLVYISWANEPSDMEKFDTIMVPREEYEPEFLQDTIGNYIEGAATKISMKQLGNRCEVVLRVEDSGIQVTYFFRFQESWKLYRVKDVST